MDEIFCPFCQTKMSKEEHDDMDLGRVWEIWQRVLAIHDRRTSEAVKLRSLVADRERRIREMREAVAKDRIMIITKKDIEDGCFNPDRSKDCACKIRAQLRKEILADIDSICHAGTGEREVDRK